MSGSPHGGSGSGSGSGGREEPEYWSGYEPPLYLPPWLEPPIAHLWRRVQETLLMREWHAAAEASQAAGSGSGSGSGVVAVDRGLRADFIGGPDLTVLPGTPIYLLAIIRGGVPTYSVSWVVTHEIDGTTDYYPLLRPTVWVTREGVYSVTLRVIDSAGVKCEVTKGSYIWAKVAL